MRREAPVPGTPTRAAGDGRKGLSCKAFLAVCGRSRANRGNDPLADFHVQAHDWSHAPCSRFSRKAGPGPALQFVQRIIKKFGHSRRPAVIRGNRTTVEPRARLARLRDLIASFRENKRGNVAILVGIFAIPIVVIIGWAVDYAMATSVRAKLQAASDAATLAAVSVNSPVVANAKAMGGSDGAVTNGTTYLANIFQSNWPSSPTPTITSSSVSKSGTVVTASLSFTAQIPTVFLAVAGFKNFTITSTSTSSYKMPTYIDFYMMLDVSGSMSFPSTAAEQTRLMAVNPDNLGKYAGGCQFACHFTAQGRCGQGTQGPIPAVDHSYAGYKPNPSPGGYCQGFIISRLGTTPTSFTAGTDNSTNGSNVNWTNTPVSSCGTAGTTSCIQLRADAVGYAVTHLLTTAANTEAGNNLANQFRVGLFPFIQNLCWSNSSSSNSCSVGLTTNVTGGTATTFATQLASLLDTGQNSTLGSGGTHFENALSTINSNISSSAIGSGTSSTDTLPYIFLITDGSQDYQTQWNGSWSSQNWSSTAQVPYQNSATTVPPNSVTSTDYCATIKGRGITIAILYIPYGQIVNPNASFASNEDGYANANIANIPPALQACASPNFLYTASTPTDIDNALQTMFQQAVKSAHVTN
jgi:Flp pilus assembly protein TadG